MSSKTEKIYEQLSVGCHAYREGFHSSYDYIPSKGAGIAFCLLFGATMIAHIVQFSWKRTWWCCVFAIGSAGTNLAHILLNSGSLINKQWKFLAGPGVRGALIAHTIVQHS